MTIAQQYVMDLVVPPIAAVLWWTFSRGWAAAVQGGNVSDRTRKRQKTEFFVVLGLLYALMLGATTYLNFLKSR